ncbi:probable membrane-associated kinase regulator 1 [Cryptomeria japonica]|uniref:probable membrane-associated kinase regulator 1 n=1 Tax=Cryptomeria japonica TaxID=3369 RepID=UPI0025ACF228|nr:probable membrane-associated kinase regulator 1 [Cryptomeria japonica]
MEEGKCDTNRESSSLSVDRNSELGAQQFEDEGTVCCNDEFEFRISVSRTQGVISPVDLCPADDLFYKGQLLPLHLPPRLQMVQNLDSSANSGSCCANNECEGENLHLLAASSTSSGLDCRSNEGKGESSNLASVTGTNSRLDCISNETKRDSDESVNSQSFWSKDSSGSSDSTSSRDSSGSSHDSSECTSALTNSEEKIHLPSWIKSAAKMKVPLLGQRRSKNRMDEKTQQSDDSSVSTERLLPPTSILSRDSSTSNRFQRNTFHSFQYSDEGEKQGNSRGPKDVFHRYLKLIKPLYEKISNKYDQVNLLGQFRMDECGNASSAVENTTQRRKKRPGRSSISSCNASFNGNLRTGRHSGVGSCPSSMRSSPNHSGVLTGLYTNATSDSTMEELQSAIQGAIAHCKQSNGIKSETSSAKDSDISS